jgi:hypothetical protein
MLYCATDGSQNILVLNAVRLGLKAVWKKYQERSGGSTEMTASVNLLIATVAGIINVLSTTPLWVVSTRLSVRELLLCVRA